MLRRIKNERRIKNSKAKRRENLDKEEDSRSFGRCGEAPFNKSHCPSCRSMRPLLSSSSACLPAAANASSQTRSSVLCSRSEPNDAKPPTLEQHGESRLSLV